MTSTSLLILLSKFKLYQAVLELVYYFKPYKGIKQVSDLLSSVTALQIDLRLSHGSSSQEQVKSNIDQTRASEDGLDDTHPVLLYVHDSINAVGVKVVEVVNRIMNAQQNSMSGLKKEQTDSGHYKNATDDSSDEHKDATNDSSDEHEDATDDSSDDDESDVVSGADVQNPFEVSTSPNVSNWKLKNGELVIEVLAQNTTRIMMWSEGFESTNFKCPSAWIIFHH
ncbi:hypothetical protein G9A89_002966 [Geosiphon pyriformis]|nr:hypothetical protein G9A89_002966 [Geosiphon pyriformis]